MKIDIYFLKFFSVTLNKITTAFLKIIPFQLAYFMRKLFSSRSSLVLSHKVIIISFFTFFFTNKVLADYTIASGSNINASTITGQSGVLIINGTLSLSSNVSLLNFTTVIINGPNGQILWTNNSDLTFSAGVIFVINNPALGLQPTGGNASQRLYFGATLVGSGNGGGGATQSFSQFNSSGGTSTLPQINIGLRSKLVMNGSVFLVVNNAAFENDGGQFIASASTVKFSGYMDTTFSYVSGTQSTTFNNLTVNKTAFGTALKSAAGVVNTLGVYGGYLYADSNLTLLSDANYTARVDAVTAGSDIIGKAKVERYIPSRRAWRLMTAPVTSANTILNSWQNGGVYTVAKGTMVTAPGATGTSGNGIDISPLNNVSMKKWDVTTQTYLNVLNSKVPISAGSSGSADNTGYFIFVRGDRDVNNFIIPNTNITTITSIGKLQTGTQVFSASSVANGYTLIGNPYASPVNFNSITRTNVVKRFYVWDPTLNVLGGYVMLDDTDNGDGIYIKSVGASGQTTDIQSSQAFFVQTTANGTASVTFNESNKSSTYLSSVFRPMEQNNTINAIGSLRANLYLLNADSTTLLADGTLAQFDDSFSDSVKTEDAVKFTNINENIAFLRYGVTLTADRRPLITLSDTLFLKLWRTTQRSYQFEFTPEDIVNLNLIGYLQDKYLNTNTQISLSNPTKINFSIDANAASSEVDRFKIVFKIFKPFAYTSLIAYPKNNLIPVEWKVEYETNILKYDVEKSIDGNQFARINTINVTGNNNVKNNYDWLDENPTGGDNFYRIKMFAANGQTKYSDIVKVVMGTKTNGISIYPNPIQNNTISLQINNQATGNYQLRLTNSLGQLFYTGSLQIAGSYNKTDIKVTKKMVPGIFYLQITGPDNKTSTEKIIVE